MSGDPKLSYNSTLHRVRVEFTRSHVQASSNAPADLIDRARKKMESVQAGGAIGFFDVYESDLNHAWTGLRESLDVDQNQVITVTLAAGAPTIEDFKVAVSPTGPVAAVLDMPAVPDLNTWRMEHFLCLFRHHYQHAGGTRGLNYAQVQGAFERAKGGEAIKRLAIAAVAPATGNEEKPYAVIANKARHEIGVLIYDFMALKSKENRDAMLGLVSRAVKKMNTAVPDANYRLLKQDFIGGLQAGLSGAELVGVGVPTVLLAAIGSKTEGSGEDSAKPKAPKIDPATLNAHPGAGLLAVDISADRMEAAIKDFDKAIYDDPTFQLNLDWIKLELRRLGLRQELSNDMSKALSQSIETKGDLNGLVVAVGRSGLGGRGPFLYPTYKDAPGTKTKSDGVIDIRDAQQRNTVVKGQTIAELKFKEPAMTGLDVYGEEMAPPANDEFIVQIGEGVEQRENRYVAMVDGIPTVQADSVSLSQVMVHEGDVNLRSGNIRFDGPVEIKGSIDSGAVVETTGDLLVHGTIRGGFVRVGGNLVVNSGIITGQSGRVHARGSIRAEFVENSTITCGEEMVVTKVVINSRVIVGTFLQVKNKDGVIAGGFVSCRDFVRTANLGFRNGNVTNLNVGIDWRISQGVEIRKGRIEKITKRQNEDRMALRELVQKTKAQMTERHQEMKANLQDRLQRMRLMLEKAQDHLHAVESKLSYNADARIYVENLVAPNLSIVIGGQKVSVSQEVAGVAFTPKRRRGSYYVAIEDVEEEDRENGIGVPENYLKRDAS